MNCPKCYNTYVLTMKSKISQKINTLNKTTLNSMLEESEVEIAKMFTNVGIEIFEADFGFTWLYLNNTYKLAYKSSGASFDPTVPKRNSEYGPQDIDHPSFDSNVTKENYKDATSKHMKSYVIIPINFGDRLYGNIVLCYKTERTFTEDDLALGDTISHAAAQAFTIRWLIKNQQTDLTLAEKQKTIEVLLSQEKLKTEFMANATHELRTPLAIMKGNVELALLPKSNLQTARKALEEVNLEIDILTDIVKDLALLTSSTRSETELLNPTPIDITELLGRLMRRMQIIARDKNIQIKMEDKLTDKVFISGDEIFLTKLFLNLIKNAISYGKDNGNIWIEVRTDKTKVKIKVIDDGVGISKEDLPKIFDRFYRGDKAHARSTYGSHSGLGLAIAKWGAEIHGGTVTVESILGKGSTFTVILPKLKKA